MTTADRLEKVLAELNAVLREMAQVTREAERQPTSLEIEEPGLAYSQKTAARLADCSESHIRRAINEGYLVAKNPRGSHVVRIRHEDLVAWLDDE